MDIRTKVDALKDLGEKVTGATLNPEENETVVGIIDKITEHYEGGGGGTEVIANPEGATSGTLFGLQVGDIKYQVKIPETDWIVNEPIELESDTGTFDGSVSTIIELYVIGQDKPLVYLPIIYEGEFQLFTLSSKNEEEGSAVFYNPTYTMTVTNSGADYVIETN